MLDSFLSQYVHLWKPKQVLRSKISLPVLHLHLLLHFRMLLLSAWMETSCSWLLSRRALQRHIPAVLGADNSLCGVFIFYLVMFFFFLMSKSLCCHPTPPTTPPLPPQVVKTCIILSNKKSQSEEKSIH